MGETYPATSTSYADVAAAVALASAGDTVTVPAGSSTWSDLLLIQFGITITGAGVGSTVITNGITAGSDDQCFSYSPSSPELDETFEMSGFTFDGNETRHCIKVVNKTRTVINNVLIHDCRFQNCYSDDAVFIRGEVYGVMWGCHFQDNHKDINSVGYDWYSWMDLDPAPGSAEYFVVEDCTTDYSPEYKAAYPSGGGLFAIGQGGNICYRHNAATRYFAFDIMDAHGNQQPVTDAYSPGGSRGTIALEVYENDIASVKVDGHRLLNHRGGRGIVFNNRVTGTPPSANLVLIEEDGDASYDYFPTMTIAGISKANPAVITATISTGETSYLLAGDQVWIESVGGMTEITDGLYTVGSPTAPDIGANVSFELTGEDSTAYTDFTSGGTAQRYPGWDAVRESYYNGNTINDVAITPAVNIDSLNLIKEDRDYFLTDPVGETIDGVVYATLEYPHPLRTGQPPTPPNPPENLTLTAL